MFGRTRNTEPPEADTAPRSPLKEAMHQARIEAAEQSSVVVDLRDAELARLELLNEALEPLFAEIPSDVDLFDRGISRGETPRLWIDAVAHVAMGRDKRGYRLLHDSRVGRHVLAESHEIADIVQAVTAYVARRLVERQRALAAGPESLPPFARDGIEQFRRGRHWRMVAVLLLGFVIGVLTLFAVALWSAARL